MIEYVTKDKLKIITSIEATINEIRKEVNRIKGTIINISIL